jgi:hypothetical protein
LWRQLLINLDCVFDASLEPETCLDRFVDWKGLINKFLENCVTGYHYSNSDFVDSLPKTGQRLTPDRLTRENLLNSLLARTFVRWRTNAMPYSAIFQERKGGV